MPPPYCCFLNLPPPYCCFSGAFVWDQSGIRIIGIMRVSVCLGSILIPEYLDFHSVYSAPRSRIDGIDEYILIPKYPKRTRPVPVCPRLSITGHVTTCVTCGEVVENRIIGHYMHCKSADTRIHASSMEQKTIPFIAKHTSIQACRAHLTNALTSDQTASEIRCCFLFFQFGHMAL